MTHQPDHGAGICRTPLPAGNRLVRAATRCVACLSAAAAGLVLTLRATAADERARKPNVIVILADDLGYADLGFQGCRDISTPHLDALAHAGVRFTDGYVSSPVCGPTRAGLLTGRYQQRFGFEYNPALGPKAGLPVTETTLAALLESAGYATGAVGKWHLGRKPPFHPLRRGFDEFYGFLGGARPYVPLKLAGRQPLIPHEPLVRGRDRVEDPAYLTDGFAREAAAFIDRRKGRPFFLYLAFNAVHVPLEATQKYLDRFPGIADRSRRTYAAMVSAMDDAVGRLSEKLRAEGIDRQTLIFFLSDNGGHPRANSARNDPLRGGKSSVFEGGIRVPFVVKWTGRIPAGRACSQPVSSLDIVPTALAAAEIKAPSGLHIDGVNLLPHLTGRDDNPPHRTLYWRYGRHRAVRHGRWKLTMPAGEPAGLYDLSRDAGESRDLSADRPDVVETLQKLYACWNAGLQPPAWRALFMKDAPGPASSGK